MGVAKGEIPSLYQASASHPEIYGPELKESEFLPWRHDAPIPNGSNEAENLVNIVFGLEEYRTSYKDGSRCRYRIPDHRVLRWVFIPVRLMVKALAHVWIARSKVKPKLDLSRRAELIASFQDDVSKCDEILGRKLKS